jgi:hypothetical protein
MMKKLNWLLRKLWYGYRFTAVTLLNTLVALVLLNAILSAVFMVQDYLSLNLVSRKYGKSTINAVYHGLSEGEIEALLKETWSRPFVYEPFTQFKERPYRGFYVNVDNKGFRITKNQGSWPPQSKSLNIFLFGGSTTFGYGVQDDQTIASHLQEYLTTRLDRDVKVYNFGRGDYYSTQERILYEKLLASGFVPDMAIFIDGLNDFYYNSNEPRFTRRLSEVVNNGKTSIGYKVFVTTKTLNRAVRGVRIRLSKWFREERQSEKLSEKADADVNRRKFGDPEVIHLVIKRYLMNKRMIEAVSMPFGVKPIFVWQPAPTYHYDQRYHSFSGWGFGQHSYSQYGYERMAELIEKNPLGDNFLWCADIQKDKEKSLYVDLMHYSADFSKEFAMVIADLLVERQLAKVHVEDSK